MLRDAEVHTNTMPSWAPSFKDQNDQGLVIDLNKADIQTHSLAKLYKFSQSVDQCLGAGIPEWKAAKEQRKVDGKCD